MIFKRKKKASFEFMAPEAKKVLLTGDFTRWKEKGLKLKKSQEGIWKIDVSLHPGRYEYKFIVDGQWQNDPSVDQSIRNAFGSQNSVKEVGV